MKAKYIQIFGVVIVAIGLVFTTFLYWSEPKSFAEVSTKGQVVLGTYEIDRVEFDRGVALFRNQDFPGARSAFVRADPEKRSAEVQFYTAYSFYREGWGRISNDDVLFAQGLAAAQLATRINPDFRTSDESLKMRSVAELRTELKEGLKLTASDFNPLKLTRERK